MKCFRAIFFIAGLFFCAGIAAQKKQIRITCVGNSITYGHGVQEREKNSYPAQLQSMLGNHYKVMNFGVRGRTLLRKGNLPYWKETAFQEAVKSSPDVVFIMLGTNDSKAMNRPFYHEFAQDYSDLIDTFRNLASHPRVIMLLPVAAFTTNPNQIYDSVIVNNIIPMCREVAWKKKCELIDLHPMFLDKKEMLFDGVHPTSIGDQLIAQRLYEQLQSTVEKDNVFSQIKEPSAISNFYGFDCVDFKFEGRDCKIVKPRTATKGKPWIWRARFWGHEPQTDIALLERGFYVVYCDASEQYGNKKAISLWNDFYKKMRSLGLDKKAAMEGMSRGGAYVYNWASVNPDKVACVYADAPVLDFKSWPGGKGTGAGSGDDWEIFKKDYGLATEQQALDFKGNPLDKVKEIAEGHYPMLHVVGDADDIVPVSENTAKFEKAIKPLGGDIRVIHKPGVNHHPHSLQNPERIVNFILRATRHKINYAIMAAPGAEYRSLPAGWVEGTSWYDQAENIQHTLDSLGKVDFLMLGNSITLGIGKRSLVAHPGGQDAFDKQFIDYKFGTAGISGDRVQNLTWRIENYNYKVSRPGVVIITVGVNNFLDDCMPEEIVAGLKKLVAVVHEKIPGSKILLIGPLPAGKEPGDDLRKKYDAVYDGIQFLKNTKGVTLFKYSGEMLLPGGNQNPDYFAGDGIHLLASGYAQWAKLLYRQMMEEKLLPKK